MSIISAFLRAVSTNRQRIVITAFLQRMNCSQTPPRQLPSGCVYVCVCVCVCVCVRFSVAIVNECMDEHGVCGRMRGRTRMRVCVGMCMHPRMMVMPQMLGESEGTHALLWRDANTLVGRQQLILRLAPNPHPPRTPPHPSSPLIFAMTVASGDVGRADAKV